METMIIQVKKETAQKIKDLKISNRESYDEIINRLLEQEKSKEK